MRGKEGAPNLRSRSNQNSARSFVGISIREISCLHAKPFLRDSAGVTAQNKECCIRRPCTAQQTHTNPAQKGFAWCGKFALKCKSGIQKLVVLLVVEIDVVLEVLAVLEEVEVVVNVKEVELVLEEKVEVDVVLEVLDVEIVEDAVVVLVQELPDALSRLSS